MGENDNSRSRTVWCGNLSEKTTEIILYELFLQAGPIEDVNIPKDKEGKRRNFGFVVYKHIESVPYAIELLNGINLYGKALKLDGRDGNNKPNDNPYRLALIQHHRALSGANDGLIRVDDHSRRIMGRIQQEASQQQRANWPSQTGNNNNNWVQNNGPNVRVQPGMSRFQPGISFQMTSFMSGTTQGSFPQLNPLFMLGNNQPQNIFPWQTVGQGLSNQLSQIPLQPPQDHWFSQVGNQRRF